MAQMPETTARFPALRDIRYPVHKIADQLEPYLRAIVENLHPEKIILFGSQAYGQPTNHSDVDLLVVREGLSGKRGNMEVREVLWEVDAPPTSFTILSRTPEELRQKLETQSQIYQEIAEKGVLLYAA